MGRIFMLLLLVLAIAMLVPSTRARMIDQKTALMDRINERLVPRRLEAMADQIETHLGRGDRMPQPFPPWLERSFTGAPHDPWGKYYYLEESRRSFTVGSAGPDTLIGTLDDIRVERPLPR